jgi:DUF4097 and DUF4098 domain-containing protein YvlB
VNEGVRARKSIFPALLLIVLGLLFLLHQINPAFSIGHLARTYWPLVFILWGVAKLIDHIVAQSAGQVRAPLLSGGEAALLMLLVFVLVAFVFHDWIRDRFPGVTFDVAPFHRSFSQSRQLAVQTISAGAHLTIESGYGSITVHGTGGNELRVGITESASGADESAADDRMKNVSVVVQQSGGGYIIRPVQQTDFQGTVSVDLDVQVPKSASVTLRTPHGDINASGIAGAVDARTENGQIGIHDTSSDVSVQMEKGDARITGVAGNVTLKGRCDDVEIADVAGNVTLDGAFMGSTIVRKVGKTTQYASPRTILTATQLTGRLEIDSGNIQLSEAAGLTRIQTRNKDISVENVAGPLDIANSHGNVRVASAAPPRESISITNDSGGVDLTLPAKSSFQIAAFSREGEVDSEFEDAMLKKSGEEKDGRLDGQFGGKSAAPAPKITITTSYGTIELHKSS